MNKHELKFDFISLETTQWNNLRKDPSYLKSISAFILVFDFGTRNGP